jgi:membrane-associated phospholipid phosphatase
MKDFSIDIIGVIRNEYSNKHIDKFIMVVSAVLDKYGVAISVVIAQVLLSMAKFQQLMVALTITVFSNTLIKMVVRDPRPFFDNDSFSPAKCEFEYGFPSGHAQTAVTFYLTLLCLLFREYHIKKQKSLLYFLVFTWCWLIGFTRIFLGVHTIEQILTGFGLGVIVHIFVLHIFNDTFEKALEGLETGKTKFWNPILYFYIFADLSIVFLYMYNSYANPISTEWMTTIHKQCMDTDKFVNMDYESLNKIFTTSGKLGGYCAIFIIKSYHKADLRKVSVKNYKTFSIRVLVNLVLGGIASKY